MFSSRHGCLFLVAAMLAGRCISTLNAQSPSASALLEQSISYHDPSGRWGSEAWQIVLTETRPNGADRSTALSFDPGEAAFTLDQDRDGHRIHFDIRNQGVNILLDGQVPTDTALIRRYNLTRERALLLRDYYAYLYGLPMKLKDPGTILDPQVLDTTYRGIPVYGLQVTYDQEVGHDTWYFYLDKQTAALKGYRFYHDEAAHDGEYITLEGEAHAGPFILPKVRKWYTHQEDKYLGADIIE